MRSITRFTLAVLFCASLGVAVAAEPFEWSGTMSSGDRLEIQNIVGDISAEPSGSSRVEVVATKSGDRDDFDEVEIEVVESSDGLTVCVTYPGMERDDDSPCRSRGKRKGTHYELDVSVELSIRVPRGVELSAQTISGDVDALGLDARVEAGSVDGDVRISTSDVAEANTVSGSLDVTMGSLDWKSLSFNTVSGDITLAFPDDLETKVQFESLSGRFRSEFEMESESKKTNAFGIGVNVRGTIGDGGGRRLRINTVDGSARIISAAI